MKTLIYTPNKLTRNAGGPAGYLWHLKQGLKGHRSNDGFVFVCDPPKSSVSATGRSLDNAIRRIPFVWRLLKSCGPTGTAKMYRDVKTRHVNDYLLPAWLEDELKTGDYSAIHVHSTIDALRAHNSLNRIRRRDTTSILLSSHCPEIPALEQRDVAYEHGLWMGRCEALKNRLEYLDLVSFSLADHIIFPCEEAMEPYFQTSEGFRHAISGKNIQFLLTGIEDPPPVSAPIEDIALLRSKYCFSFVGRHNKVKGYDILADSLLPLLREREDTCVFVGGSPGSCSAPSHNRWYEFGWIDWSSALIKSSTVFILPNRRTYFDLVALEVMALGVPILASNTGGNKSLAEISEGVVLFEPSKEGLTEAVSGIMCLSELDLKELGAANRKAYLKELNADVFANRYVELINKCHLEA